MVLKTVSFIIYHQFGCLQENFQSQEYKKSSIDRYKWYITNGATYDELLLINSDVSVHHRHLRFLVTETFKSVNSLNSHFMWAFLKISFYPYDLRKGNTLHLPPAHSTRHGINLFRGNLLWNKLHREIKESLSADKFKKRLKEHEVLPCSRVVCRYFRCDICWIV